MAMTIPNVQTCGVCQRRFAIRSTRFAVRQTRLHAAKASWEQDLATGPCKLSRRQLGASQAILLAASVLNFRSGKAEAAGLPEEKQKMICEADCQAKLEELQTVTTASGLKYKDIETGKGPKPPVGFQVVANYVAMTPQGRVFDSSLERGAPYDFRVGAGQVIPGLDEGIRSMQPGGVRRLYIPGNLAFPKGVPSAAGRPRIPPGSPVVFDVQLVYVPGLDEE